MAGLGYRLSIDRYESINHDDDDDTHSLVLVFQISRPSRVLGLSRDDAVVMQYTSEALSVEREGLGGSGGSSPPPRTLSPPVAAVMPLSPNATTTTTTTTTTTRLPAGPGLANPPPPPLAETSLPPAPWYAQAHGEMGPTVYTQPAPHHHGGEVSGVATVPTVAAGPPLFYTLPPPPPPPGPPMDLGLQGAWQLHAQQQSVLIETTLTRERELRQELEHHRHELQDLHEKVHQLEANNHGLAFHLFFTRQLYQTLIREHVGYSTANAGVCQPFPFTSAAELDQAIARQASFIIHRSASGRPQPAAPIHGAVGSGRPVGSGRDRPAGSQA